MKIERWEGETYPGAVSRVIAMLNDDDRDVLRELVAWVMDYEKADSRLPEAKPIPADRRNKGGSTPVPVSHPSDSADRRGRSR